MRKTLLTLLVFATAWLAPLSVRMPQAQAATAVAAAPAPAESARVIVKYRTDSPMLQRKPPAGSEAADRAQVLGTRVGIAMRTGRAISHRSQVVVASGIDSVRLAARLAQMSDVEYAVPDKRRRALAVPNDPLYLSGPPIVGLTGGPASGQWYLRPPTAEVPASIDAESAWDTTTGNPAIVVAVIDTGVRFDHADLKRAAQGGVLLDGYDMIGPDLGSHGDSLGTFKYANDADGRDADASDPGDAVSTAEVNDASGRFYHCVEPDPNGNYVGQTSSWHGTQIAGLVGALTDNATGMASVARGVQLLPVRVLGKCGGYDSDIAAGMLWAAGIDVPGVPSNGHPAKVLNLSLGGSDACSSLYTDAVSQIVAKGVVIVASAGNEEGHAVDTPANCAGVIAVAGLRHVGSKVGFSSIGPEVAISAPGGNCVDVSEGAACQYPILTTANSGSTEPVSDAAGGSIYTDAFNASAGTSFSAPLVAGTAALMLSAQPALAPAELRVKLQATARAFPSSGGTDGTLQCVAPYTDRSGNYVDQDECYCTTATCGAGMLDARAAVLAATGVQARIGVDASAPVAGTVVTFSAAPSLLTAGHSIASYLWTVADAGGIVTSFVGATDGATAAITPTAAGTFSVMLTTVDNTGASSSARSSVQVAAAPVTPAPPSSNGGGGGGALGWGWLAMLAAAVLALAVSSRQRRKR